QINDPYPLTVYQYIPLVEIAMDTAGILRGDLPGEPTAGVQDLPQVRLQIGPGASQRAELRLQDGQLVGDGVPPLVDRRRALQRHQRPGDALGGVGPIRPDENRLGVLAGHALLEPHAKFIDGASRPRYAHAAPTLAVDARQPEPLVDRQGVAVESLGPGLAEQREALRRAVARGDVDVVGDQASAARLVAQDVDARDAHRAVEVGQRAARAA